MAAADIYVDILGILGRHSHRELDLCLDHGIDNGYCSIVSGGTRADVQSLVSVVLVWKTD